MRVTSAFSRLLDLSGVWVRSVCFEPGRIVVAVALRQRRLRCPKCSYSTWHRESRQHHNSIWRHLDLGVWRLEIHARLRRLRCPEHGVHVEGVPFARDGARFTRDFESLVAWLATKTDKTATCRLTRIDWQTIGRIVERVGGELIDADRLTGLFETRDLPGAAASAVLAGAVITTFTWLAEAAASDLTRVFVALAVGFVLLAPSTNHSVVGFGEILFGLVAGTTSAEGMDLLRNTTVRDRGQPGGRRDPGRLCEERSGGSRVMTRVRRTAPAGSRSLVGVRGGFLVHAPRVVEKLDGNGPGCRLVERLARGL